MKKKDNRGGKRENAGRKPLPYKTKVIAFRVREEYENELKELVKNRIKELDLLNKYTK